MYSIDGADRARPSVAELSRHGGEEVTQCDVRSPLGEDISIKRSVAVRQPRAPVCSSVVGPLS